jgi:hypothetical protein
MKKNTITLGMLIPEHEKKISTARERINAQVVKDARMHASSDRPLVSDKSAVPYTGTYTAQWMQTLTELLASIQQDAHASKIILAIQAAKKTLAGIKAMIVEREHENKLAKYEIGGKVPTGNKLGRIGLLYFLGSFLAEIAFNSWSFEFLGSNLLFSILIAIGIGLGTIILARGVLDVLAKRDTLGRKAYAIAAGIFAVALVFFSGLSIVRSQMMASENVSLGSWWFLSGNLFFFLVALLVCHFYFPKQKETDEERELCAKHDGIKKRDAEIERLKNEYKTVSETLAKDTADYLHLSSIASHDYKRINALHRETIELYKSTNLIARKDQATPEFFNDSIPDLPEPPAIDSIDINPESE